MDFLAARAWGRRAPVWGVCLLVLFLAIVLGTQTGLGLPGHGRRAAGASERNGWAAGGRLVVGVQQEPERLTECFSATATNNLVGSLIHARFVKYTPDLELVPDVIERIPTVENGGISPDMLTITYRLRDGVRWQDGTPLTSADVRFTYEMIMDPEVHVESRDGWDVIESVATPDDRTVVFKLREPYPDFVGSIFNDEAILPRHLLLHETGAAFNDSEYHRHPMGSGPFVFHDWVSGSHITLVRNDDYYGEGPYLDEIIIKFVPDDNALLVQLQAGDIDVYDNANASFVEQVKRMPSVTVYTTPTLMYEHLDMNTEHPILSDRRVRRALSYATNKRFIVDNVYGGFAQVADLDEHPASPYFSPAAAAKNTFNPTKARRLLRDAGWVDRDDDGILVKDGRRLALTISATSGNPNRERTEVVLREMYREVGVDLTIRNYSPQVLYGSYEDGGILKRGNFDLAMYAFLSSPEPSSKESSYSADYIPPRGQNHPRIRNEELTALLERGAREIDPSARVAIYNRVEEILVEEAPVIPLFWYTTVDFCTSELRNYRPNPTPSADSWNANLWHLGDEVARRR